MKFRNNTTKTANGRCKLYSGIGAGLFLGFFILNVLYILYPYRLVRPVDVASCEWHGYKSPIPKVVHRIWLEGSVPQKFRRYAQECGELSPNWEQKMWNETDILGLARQHFPWSVPVYQGYPRDLPNQRSNFGRYLLLYLYGGLSVDTDMRCKLPLDTILAQTPPGADVVLGEAWPLGISANIFLAKKKHPFIYQMFTNLNRTKNESYFLPLYRSMMTTGTIFVHKNYINYPCKNQVAVVGRDKHHVTWFHHEAARSWNKVDGKIVGVLGDVVETYVANKVTLCLLLLLFLLFTLKPRFSLLSASY